MINFIFCRDLTVNINVKYSFLRSEFPFKGNGNYVLCVCRLGEPRLYKTSMIYYSKTKVYQL